MYSKIMLFGLLFLSLTVGAVKAADTLAAEPNQQTGTQSQKSVSGTLESIADTMLSVKTIDGETKEYSIKTEKKSQIQSMGLKKGDHITAQVDQQNQVIEITKQASGG